MEPLTVPPDSTPPELTSPSANSDDDLNDGAVTPVSDEIQQNSCHTSLDDEDSDVGSDPNLKKWVLNPAPRPQKISKKKRADAAAFDQWIEKNQCKLSQPERQYHDEDQSVNRLVRGLENKKIITSPRDYQIELFERAKLENTIAVLDTGTSCVLPPSW
jgi:endoribonuclease Dicer